MVTINIFLPASTGKPLSTSFRVNLNLSPNLTFQYWGQPFIATGKYYDYKYILDPMAEKYRIRFTHLLPDQINLSDDQYEIDENTDGTSDYQLRQETILMSRNFYPILL